MLRIGWLVVVVVTITTVLASRWHEVQPHLGDLHVGLLAGAAALSLAAIGLSGEVWRSQLAGLGARLGFLAGLRVFFVGQLGKYLPGSVWPLLAQTELGRDHAVPPRATFAAVALFMWVHLVSGAAVAAAALGLSGTAPGPVALISLPCLALLAPGLLRPVLRLGLRLTRREPFDAIPDARVMLRTVAWAAAMWLAYGLHLHLAVAAFGAAVPPLAAVGTFAAAWTAGFVFLVAPAGAGVREATMVWLLLPVLSPGAALAVAVVSRLILTAGDVAWGAAGLAVRPHRGGPDARRTARPARSGDR